MGELFEKRVERKTEATFFGLSDFRLSTTPRPVFSVTPINLRKFNRIMENTFSPFPSVCLLTLTWAVAGCTLDLERGKPVIRNRMSEGPGWPAPGSTASASEAPWNRFSQRSETTVDPEMLHPLPSMRSPELWTPPATQTTPDSSGIGTGLPPLDRALDDRSSLGL
jgi:hypothetical protein